MGLANVVPSHLKKDWFVLKLDLKGGTKGKEETLKQVSVKLVFGKLERVGSVSLGTNDPFEGRAEAPASLQSALKNAAKDIRDRYGTRMPMDYTQEAMELWLWDEAKKQWRERYSQVFPA